MARRTGEEDGDRDGTRRRQKPSTATPRQAGGAGRRRRLPNDELGLQDQPRGRLPGVAEHAHQLAHGGPPHLAQRLADRRQRWA